jgi:hypothetical protein
MVARLAKFPVANWVVVLACAAPAVAQDATPAKLTAPNARGRSNLVVMALLALTQPEGSADVGLSPEQVARVHELSKSLHSVLTPKLKGLEGLPTEELETKAAPALDEFARDGEKGLAEILDTAQLRRSRQIVLQICGTSAFRLREVGEALKLTEEQRTKMEAIRAEHLTRFRELAGQKGNFEARQATMRENQKRREAEVLALLSDEQKRTWTDMIGKQYDRFAPSQLQTKP